LQQAFIASVIAEGIEPKSAFPFEPYPADKTVYKNTRLVEFETPANKDGLGTSTRLRKDSIPIQGMAKFKVWFRPAAPIFICWGPLSGQSGASGERDHRQRRVRRRRVEQGHTMASQGLPHPGPPPCNRSGVSI
jgi:hypothetical protein